MMIRSFVFLIALLPSVIMAGGISHYAALQKAQQFMPHKKFVEGSTLPSAQARAFRENNAFYVFNAEGDDGFVIVSGDDRTTPILGYSEQGNLDISQIPDNMKWWLEGYVQQIEALDKSLTPAVRTANMSQAASVSPLILSQWSQDSPYNHMCPDGNFVDYDEPGYDANNRSAAGCVATAMAQVMNYWQWPRTCPAVEGYGYINGKDVKALPSTTFDWAAMKNTYTQGETGASADAVAKLMRYCGQAAYTSYSPSESAASSPNPRIMANIFQYSPNSYLLYRDYYSTSEWESIVYDELAAKRPVLYGGQSLEEGGHQFIIDGYDGNGLFHINWGWGGNQDSYYVLSLADPSGDGDGYQYGQDALIGLQPAHSAEIMRPSIYSYTEPSTPSKTYCRHSSNMNFEDVELEGRIKPSFALQPESDINIEIGWAIYRDGDFIQTIGSRSVVIEHDEDYSYFNYHSVPFGADLPNGSYQICQVYRFPGETEWKRCFPKTYTLKAEVSSASLIVSLPDASDMSFHVNSIHLPDQPAVGEESCFSVNITNTGETDRLPVSLWLQKQGETAWKNVATKNGYAAPGARADVSISYTPQEAGTFNVKITAGSDETALKTDVVNIASTEVITLNGITYRYIPEYRRAIIIQNDDADKSVSEITIPSTVTASGVECKVVGIGENAFKYYDNVKTLIIPEGVETIGRYAFAYMGSLTKLTLPTTLREIGEYVIYGNVSLDTVESRAANPIIVRENTFVNRSWNSETQIYNITPSPATLYVPIGSKEMYEDITGWTEFAAIVEKNVTGIIHISITSDNGSEAKTHFNMNGQRIPTVQKGINIVKYSDGRTEKVMVIR